MSSSPPKPPAKRDMKQDEKALWEQVTKGVNPLSPAERGEKDKAGEKTQKHWQEPPEPSHNEPAQDFAARRAEFEALLAGKDKGSAKSKSQKLPCAAKSKTSDKAPAPQNKASQTKTPQTIEQSRQKKIASGQVSIDSKIDLHGLRQHEAYDELRAFLFRAIERGHRHVLVITGKGTRISEQEAQDFYADFNSDQKRGVIKAALPGWLNNPDLAPHIISFGPAHQRHGGAGATYIHLRKTT